MASRSFAAMGLVRRATFQNAVHEAASATRGFRAGKPSLGGADSPHYEHAERMYEIEKMTNRKLKFGLGIVTILGLGFGIPAFAVWFSNKKLET